jgi:hypothetical protein
VRVQEEQTDDEIAMLGQLFNQMTRQLKGQRDALIEQNAATEARRRLFDSVLSGDGGRDRPERRGADRFHEPFGDQGFSA